MRVALIQTALEWENPYKNRNHFESKIHNINEAIDLIVLPEMFTTGFSMHPEAIAETMEGETVQWMKKLSEFKDCAITGSVIIRENDTFFNRLLFVFPSGEVAHYDKRHLFTLAGEDQIYTAGTSRLVVEYKGYKICPLICYDLRFPVFSRNTENYDVLIYVANWPKPRINAWDALLKARSIENMCYTIGVNRTGSDANKQEYVGHSQVLDCLGNYLLEPELYEGVYIVTLDKAKILETRSKFGFLEDRDRFTVLN